MSRALAFAHALAAAVALAIPVAPSLAVLLASGDPTANRAAPEGWVPTLPFAHVAKRDQYSAVYLGNRWVLTAAHVGAFGVEIEGVSYAPVDGSRTRVRNVDGSASDLLAYRIDGDPGLPLLRIARSSPVAGERVWLIGQGVDRGDALQWTSPDGVRRRGFRWASTRSMRWGTNRIESGPLAIDLGGARTRVLSMDLSLPNAPGATRFEAQATTGDSGGALFVHEGAEFALAGILVVRTFEPNQPRETSFFGNRTLAADLASYRDQLIALVRPACSDEVDNDVDGATDHPADADCASPESEAELGLAPSAPRESPRP